MPNLHKCRFCDWKMRYYKLNAHIQRRHPDEYEKIIKVEHERTAHQARDKEETIKER